ncbi:MAG TPA: flagellar basal body-associated FliL family protein [Chloroflexota bacterium]|jgi:flagellar basal body-associated protein FliL|nr:flagellar basal body-associated FliL family protein [Chloroflexota bacterium]
MIRANDKGLASAPAVVEEPPRAGLINGRNLIILVGIVAWLAVLLLFIVPNLTKKPEQPAIPATTTTAAQAASGATTAAATTSTTALSAGSAPKAVPSPELDINGRVFNLAGNAAGYKYVKLSVVVQFVDTKGDFAKASGAALTKLDQDFAASHAGATNAFNDILTTTVSSKTAADLATPQGKEALRQELISKFNGALAGTNDRVSYVLFSDFVMQ